MNYPMNVLKPSARSNQHSEYSSRSPVINVGFVANVGGLTKSTLPNTVEVIAMGPPS